MSKKTERVVTKEQIIPCQVTYNGSDYKIGRAHV